jgi:O-antigen/teichoic acid export membrane protein
MADKISNKTFINIGRQVSFTYWSTGLMFVLTPLLVLILTRSLSVKDYGAYALLAVTINIAGVMLDFGFTQYFVSYFSGASGNRQKNVFRSLLVYLFGMLIVLGAVVFFTPLNTFFVHTLGLESYGAAFSLAIGIIICVTLIRMFTAYFTVRKRLILTQTIFLVSQLLWIALLTVFFIFTRSIKVETVFLIWLIGTIATFLLCGLIVRRELFISKSERKKSLETKHLADALRYGLPILMVGLGAWIIEIGDRYLLNGFLGKDAVGLYTLIYSLLGVVATLGTVVVQTIFPYLASVWSRNKEDASLYLNASVKYALMLVIPALAGFFILRQEIITMVSGTSYSGAAVVVPYLILYPLLLVLNYIAYQIVVLTKKVNWIAVIYLAGAAVNIGLNLVLIPRFGINGAGIATTISYAFVFVLLAKLANAHISINMDFLKLGRILAATAIMVLCIFFIHPSNVIEKLATVVAGFIIYSVFILLFKVLSKKEWELLQNILPAQLKAMLKNLGVF